MENETIKAALNVISKLSSTTTGAIVSVLLLAAMSLLIWGIWRTKAPIEKIKHLPKKDRLEAIKIATDNINQPKDIPTEHWIKARLHRYIFLAFLTIIAAIVMIASIVAIKTSQQDTLPKKITPTPLISSNVKINYTRKYIESHLGAPQTEETLDSLAPSTKKPFKRVNYSDGGVELEIFYDNNESIIRYTVSWDEDETGPEIPLLNQIEDLKSIKNCLGKNCLTFADLGLFSIPHYYNAIPDGSAPTTYSEIISIPNSISPVIMQLTASLPIENYSGNKIINLSYDTASEINIHTERQEDACQSTPPPLTDEQKKELNIFRTSNRPNSYTIERKIDQEELRTIQKKYGYHTICS